MANSVVVTGATGFLGRQVLAAFKTAGWNAVGTGYSRANAPSSLKLDLSDEKAVGALLAQHRPEVVIHCAANRFPDKCDQDPEGARRLNVQATKLLAQLVAQHSTLLIYISTDYVFPGRPGEAPYEADAEPQPTNLYGQTKLDGEKAVLESMEDIGLGVILRVPVLYGKANESKESAINVLMDAVQKAQEKDAQIKMDHWAQRYPTNTEDVARVCLDVATKYLQGIERKESLPKILQFSAEDRFTKYEICGLFAEIMGLPLNGMVADTVGVDPKVSVQRPYDTHLSTKVLKDLGIKVHTQDFKAWCPLHQYLDHFANPPSTHGLTRQLLHDKRAVLITKQRRQRSRRSRYTFTQGRYEALVATMDRATIDSEPSPNGAIARSRSRYKGNRPHKGVAADSLPPKHCSEHFYQHGGYNHPKHTNTDKGVHPSGGVNHMTIEKGQIIRIADGKLQRTIQGVSGRVTNKPPRNQHKDVETGNTEHFRTRHEASTQSPHKQQHIVRDRKLSSKTYAISDRLTYEHSSLQKSTPRPQRSANVNDAQRAQDEYAESPGKAVCHPEHTVASDPSTWKSYERDAPVAPIRRLALPKKSLTQHIVSAASPHRDSKNRDELKKTISAPLPAALDFAAKPAFDAPISAVNAGERRVTVKYNQSVISAPITPSTTPVELIRAASTQLSVAINPTTTVLLESFKQLGLERPLRRYEHIRDVMNSWANDAENTLIIAPSPTGGRDDDLDIQYVSKQQPTDTSVEIYHSQRPGSWHKRWITLRADGQVLAAKKDGMINICHLSDFDIYLPTARQLSKKIKPHKKLCFAIKSQQKSSMFLSTENFVHFFSTNDKALATQWYKAVQGWRSWYLVHVMGEGHKEEKSAQLPVPNVDQQQSSNHHVQDSKPFERSFLGSDQERVQRYKERLLPSRSGLTETVPSEPELHAGVTPRTPGQPTVSYSKKLTKDANTNAPFTRKRGPSSVQTQPARRADSESFAATGLLGRSYTLRRKAQQERGDHLAVDGGSAPDMVAMVDTSPNRTSSQRPKQKPLVDLTPQYHEPPQHRKGRGVIPEQIPARGLVEVATSPERAIPIPPATACQRPVVESQPILRRLGTMRNRGNGDCSPVKTRQTSTSPEKMPFTAGLLAEHSQSQGDRGHGRGVRNGTRSAEAPMIDMDQVSQYAPGSLLASIEKNAGSNGCLVIEREKKRELEVAVGEGM
ncbi:MAG: hypothetical protein Q9217_002746 [Psora testacea]